MPNPYTNGLDPGGGTDTTAGYTNWGPYLSLLGGGMQFGASMAQGGANAALARAQASITGLQARGEAEAGAETAELYRQHLTATVGKQQAQIGGANVTTSGSALRSLATTAQLGAQDIVRIQTNAARKAWGFETTQAGDLARAGWEQKAGTLQGLGALITSGARAYGQWG
jgi:hypothetical protein